MPVTPGGIPYSVRLTSYSEQWINNGRQIVVQLQCAGVDAADFKKELVGFTTWDGATLYLQRTLPMLCPYTNDLYCMSADLVKFGFRNDDSRTSFADPFSEDWINFNDPECWVVYQTTWQRPPYNRIVEDAAILPWGDAGTAKEIDRYCTITRKQVAREQKFSSYQIEVRDGSPTPPKLEEPYFRPDYSLLVSIKWHQVPAEAVPWTRWDTMVGCVNAALFTIPYNERISISYQAQKVRFRGYQDDNVPYGGADGGLYYDPVLLLEIKGGPDANPFTGDPGATWNTIRKSDGTYAPMYVGSAPKTDRPHETANFNQLLLPGS